MRMISWSRQIHKPMLPTLPSLSEFHPHIDGLPCTLPLEYAPHNKSIRICMKRVHEKQDGLNPYEVQIPIGNEVLHIFQY